MAETDSPAENLARLSELKEEILDIMNRLRETTGSLQKGLDVSNEQIKSLFDRGEDLGRRIGAVPGMAQAGDEFKEHIQKIGKAIQDLKNFDALQKEKLVTGVRF
jgi:DNA anti-recombination protein RmuC